MSYRMRCVARVMLLVGMLASLPPASAAETWPTATKPTATEASAVLPDGLTQPVPPLFPQLYRYVDTCNVYILRDGDAVLLFDLAMAERLRRPTHSVSSGSSRSCSPIITASNARESTRSIMPSRKSPHRRRSGSCSNRRPTFAMVAVAGRHVLGVRGELCAPPARPIRLDRGLSDGEAIDWHGYQIDCHFTPGHSPGSLSYVVRRDGQAVAITGGLIHDGAKMSTWFDTEWDYGFAKGIDTLMASVEKLATLEPDAILPSHGPVILNPVEQLAAYQGKLGRARATFAAIACLTPSLRNATRSATDGDSLDQSGHAAFYKLSHDMHGKNFAIIISDNGRGLILDAGLFSEERLDEIIVGLRAHMGLKEIDAFWVSHMHGDHFLLGPTLKRKYGAEAWTLDRIADKCEHPRRYDYAALVSAYGDGFDGMAIEKKFRDGEVIDWEGYRIQIDWMPGQTEFGCCLWLDIDGRRVAFTGDNLFGSPAREEDDGHEAVVARNSVIFEEGYLYASRYLIELKPDIVMGSHSYVMPDAEAFLKRYHAWSRNIIRIYQDLLPETDYEYLLDPYWVSAYPYRVDLSTADEQVVDVTVRNFRDRPQRHRIALSLPPGFTADPPVLEGSVEADSRATYPVKLRIDRQTAPPGLQIIPFDITLDDHHYGQWFDFVATATAIEPPAGSNRGRPGDQ
ncbi:MAG: MBL fold metallo-hydrolase [Planctomycetaceae bacterium]